ncbi:MAG: hypothetical protein KC964_07820 [Candidatus Omnitrophica bacterium]|nr:hypothetical protein [Candidatus Omnitrophota bacterium]
MPLYAQISILVILLFLGLIFIDYRVGSATVGESKEGQARRHRHLKKSALLFLLVLILGGIGGGIWYWGQRYSDAYIQVRKAKAQQEMEAMREKLREYNEGLKSVLWSIGYSDGNVNDFDTDQSDDAATVDFTLGDPVIQFPHGLSPASGNQRSEVRVHFSTEIPPNSKLRVRWSPGGTDTEDQFEALLDGESMGKSPAKAGSMPSYTWHMSEFSLPVKEEGGHVISLKHVSGDGLELDYVAVAVGFLRSMPQNPSQWITIQSEAIAGQIG